MKAKLLASILLLQICFGQLVFAQTDRGVAVRPTAEKRTALVIGNGNYTKVEPLRNPVNDATDMTRVLKELGFEVFSGTDLNKEKMETLILDFGRRLSISGGVGLVYYAGHGIQVKGQNYLIPVDASIAEEDEVSYRSVAVELILAKLTSANNELNILILDACRNNPFSPEWSGYRDVGAGGGLAKLSPPTGTLVLYATEPGKKASDGEGRNGLFTAALLEQIRKPDQEYDQLVRAVSNEVWQRSKQKQLPWKEGNSLKTFYFMESANSGIGNSTPATGEAAFWKTIENSTDLKEFDNYLSKSKNGEFSGAYKAAAELKLYRIMKARASAAWPKLQHRLAIKEKYYALYFSFEDGILTEPVRLLSGRKENGMLGDYGYVDETGKLFIPHKYPFARRFSEGLAAVRIGDKFGYIDKTDRVVIPPKFDDADPFSDGLAAFTTKSGSQDYNGKKGVIDKTGREVVPAKYDHILAFSGGFARVQIYNAKGTKNGYIDKTGREITPIKYEDPYSSDFSEGLAAVEFGGKCGFIDTAGREVIPLKYDQVSSFSEGLAAVRLGDKWGFINKSGGEIIPLKYGRAISFSEGLAGVRLGDKWGYIDNAGREVIPIKFEGQAGDFRDGFTYVVIGRKLAIIDKTGRVVVPPKYNLDNYGGFVREGLFVVELNGKKGFVDIYGHEFFDF